MTDARDGPLGIRKHQCQYCPKSFKRREHWQRHSRSHTNEKPFECRFCQKCFARRDLVTRHEKTLHANDGSPSGSPTTVRRPSTAVTSNELSPTSMKSAAQDVQSPIIDQSWDSMPSLATIVSPPNPFSQDPDSHEYYIPPAVDGLEDFLDPALRMHSDGGKAWGWTTSQPPQDANAYPVSQVPETRTSSSINPLMSGNAAREPSAAIPEAVVENLLSHAPGPSLINDTQPPSNDLVCICLAAYFEAFNIHLPLIHQPSFNYAQEPPQLLLAMAAIGALYRLERKVATYLYLAAEAKFPDDNFVSDQTCAELFYAGDLASPDEHVDHEQTVQLADARTLLLLTIFGAFSGNREVSEKAVGRQGRLANAYHSIARSLQRESESSPSALRWMDWVQVESQRRFLHGIWVSCNLLTATYGIPPGVSVPLHGDVQLPCPEIIWQAATAEEWQTCNENVAPSPAIKVAVDMLCNEDHSALAILSSKSGFAITILMHAFSVHVWHSANSSGASDSQSILQGLSASKALLAERDVPALTGSLEPRPDFLFNASAVCRIASSRLCASKLPADRSAMLRGDTSTRTAAIQNYMQGHMPRTPESLDAVAGIFESFVFQTRGGTLLIRKIAGLVWSFEHMVSAWDSLLLLIKWVHATSTDTEVDEQVLRDHITSTLRRVDCEINSEGSMAAEIARFFSLFCDEWVWGVTARMGTVLHSLADLLGEAHHNS